jgi:Zn-dependent metalloprotease
MANPGTAFKADPQLGDDPQPKHYSKKYSGTADNGGVHINSGIPNKAFFEVAMGLGGAAWDKAGKIWYDTMKQLTTTSQFKDCARITQQVAGSLYGASEEKVVKNAWKSVGL